MLISFSSLITLDRPGKKSTDEVKRKEEIGVPIINPCISIDHGKLFHCNIIFTLSNRLTNLFDKGFQRPTIAKGKV
jgi:hypothetical protein